MTSAADSIDSARLVREIEELAQFSEISPPGITRVIFTDPDLRAREWLREKFREAGLKIREDAVGNIRARWQGSDPALAPVATGSHIDAIPHSGKYDGVVGVLGALEAVRALKATGHVPTRSIDIVMLTAEEPTRFGIGCVGSRALAGTLNAGQLRALRDAQGIGFDQARQEAGLSAPLEKAALRKGDLHAWIELHIEQGPILEQEQVDIGVVTAIAAPASYRVQIEGIGGHAGAVLMFARRDALCAAAEFVLAVEQAAQQSRSPDTVATVGMLDVFPGAVNSIPERISLTIDLRDTKLETREAARRSYEEQAAEISARRKVRFTFETINEDEPAESAPWLYEAIRNGAGGIGATHRDMISRAYHDSLFMARVAPMAMIFIPCRDGISHRPNEYSSPEAMERGTAVLAMVLRTAAES